MSDRPYDPFEPIPPRKRKGTNPKIKYIVCGDTQYYPWVHFFETRKEALKEYKDMPPEEDETVTICKVIDMKVKL